VGNAAFLLVAVIGSVIGSVLLWFRHRRPKTFMSSIDDFQREMKALAREQEQPASGLRSRLRARGSAPSDPDPPDHSDPSEGP
jgi:hypothetical protein